MIQAYFFKLYGNLDKLSWMRDYNLRHRCNILETRSHLISPEAPHLISNLCGKFSVRMNDCSIQQNHDGVVIAAVQFNSLYSELKFCTDSILCSLSEFCNDNIWQEWSWLEVKLKTMSLVNHITKTILYHIIIIRLQPMTATSLINF